jgi:CheY-like chemotaxis protein/HPt (histidine-containing phosphotransfer) domain-containing protein
MNAILGFTELLKRGYVRNEQESLRYLNTIHSSGKSLLELINDILDLSKVESGRFEVEKTWVDPYRIIQDVLQMLDIKAQEKSIGLVFRATSSLPAKIETDMARLRQIIYNLVGNAIKFTEQGKVAVTCHFAETSDGPRLFMEVSDTGIGMKKDRLESIFDPFVQADSTVTRQFGGTGLGLAISRKFARALGGDIEVESQFGRGSTFRVILTTGDMTGIPFLHPHEISLTPSETREQEVVQWRFPDARVLVVDDGSENRELVRIILEEAGLAVDEAENGQIGADMAGMNVYDAILMDVQMPVMDGFTATRLLRQRGLYIPIIALTANAMKGFEQDCLDAGYSNYLTKPINIDQFMDMIAEVLHGERIQGETGSPAISNSSDSSITDSAPQPQSESPLPKPVVSRLAGNAKFHKPILSFLNKLQDQIAKMDLALQNSELDELAGLAHWLKGAGGTVGYDDFTEPSAELERYARSNRPDDAGRMLQRVKGLVNAVEPPVAQDA